MKKTEKLKRKWLIYAVGGILLMGFGLTLLGESIILKTDDREWWMWFGLGTLALTVFFAGLSLFGQGVVYRTLIFTQIQTPKKKKH